MITELVGQQISPGFMQPLQGSEWFLMFTLAAASLWPGLS